MRTSLLILAGIIIGAGTSVVAATFTIDPAKSLLEICKQFLAVPTPYAQASYYSQGNYYAQGSYSTTGSVSLSNVYITGYADGDNTPKGSPVTYLNGIEGVAHGDCTFSNPTSMAVGHVITNGKDVGDFVYGTKFYVPALQCYFSAQDTCGDGSAPQNGPCHKPEEGSLQLDAYVGPNGTASCEESMTKQYSVVKNPLAGLPVKVGYICR